MAALPSTPPLALLAEWLLSSPVHFCSGMASSEKGGFSERGCRCIDIQEGSGTEAWQPAGTDVTTFAPDSHG